MFNFGGFHGWLRPDGPTITKMKAQLGGLLSGYAAPTPEQTDLHFKLRNKGEEGLLAVDPPNYKLLPNPALPPVSKTTHGSNESWVNWTARNRSDLSGVPEMLATYIKNFGDEGIVQARDFVEQWDQAKPGQGSNAIRQILSLVGDPAAREKFLGGRLPQMPPYGVLKPDAVQRIAALTSGAANGIVEDPMRKKPGLVYDPISGTYVTDFPRPEDSMLNIVGDAPARKPALPSENTQAESEQPNTAHHGLLEPYVPAERQIAEKGVEVAQNGLVTSDAYENSDDTQTAELPQPERRGKIGTEEEDLPPRPATIAPTAETTSQRNFGGGALTDDFKNPIFGKEAGGERKPLEALNWKDNDDGSGKQEVLGMYQLSRDALVDARLKNSDGSWKLGNALGVKSDDEFLRGDNAREVQEKAMEAVMRRNEEQLKASGAYGKIGTQVDGIRQKFQITDTGLAAAAHRAGPRVPGTLYLSRRRQPCYHPNLSRSNRAVLAVSSGGV